MNDSLHAQEHSLTGSLAPSFVLALALMVAASPIFGQEVEEEINSPIDAIAQLELGIQYCIGDGVPEDLEEAAKWFHKSAKQGNAAAQTLLGTAYSEGSGVPLDKKAAVVWFRRAADQGAPDAQAYLGMAYAAGEGVPEDDRVAVEWFRLAAEQGNAVGQYNLGFMYHAGEGVLVDSDEAQKWYRLAAEQGQARAQVALAFSCALESPLEAIQWLRLSAAQGNPHAQYALSAVCSTGDMLLRGDSEEANRAFGLVIIIHSRIEDSSAIEDHEEAVRWLKRAADQGHADAQLRLGIAFQEGNGVPTDTEEALRWIGISAQQGHAAAQYALGNIRLGGADGMKEAVELWTQAALQGHIKSQLLLGEVLFYGKGVSVDIKKGIEWYARAAELGDVTAAYKLGLIYWRMHGDGPGVPLDPEEAFKWFLFAANLGHAASQHAVGACYSEGFGVSVDLVAAYAWCNLAAASGHEGSQEAKEAFRKEMASEQVTQAQSLSNKLQSAIMESTTPFQRLAIEALNEGG